MPLLYDSADRTLHYAGAGHVAFYLRSDGSSQLLEADAPPLGILPDLTVPTRKLTTIETGEILILVTDGILESRNAQDEMFGESRVCCLPSTNCVYSPQPASCRDSFLRLLSSPASVSNRMTSRLSS
ncbi:MAG: PP2C family protein-serine/threonine phosphatase [Pirellulaceae bacterium]